MSHNTQHIRGLSKGGITPVLLASVASALASSASSGQLVVNTDLGFISGTSERLLTGSYAGRPNNAEIYDSPQGLLQAGGKNLGEYVFQFTTTTRGRINASWLISNGQAPARTQALLITDRLAVDPLFMVNSGVRYYNNPNDPGDLAVIIEPGTYYTVFDDGIDPYTNEILNPSGNFRALLEFQTLRLSQPITGTTSMSNIWSRPRFGGPGDPELPGYYAAYADPIPFWVDELGTYNLANVLASYGLEAYFYDTFPSITHTIQTRALNPNDGSTAYLQPHRQYWLVVSTADDVIQNPGSPFNPVVTPGPFTVQIEGAGNVTLGIIPAPSATAAMMFGMLFAARRRREPSRAR